MASLDMTAANAALKEFFNGQDMADATFKDNPLFAMVPKNNKGTLVAGKYFPMPVKYGNPQGRSRTFANAQAQQTAAASAAFLITYQRDYELATMDGLTMRAMRPDSGAFIDAWSLQVDGAHDQIVRNCASSLYRDASGIIGQISSLSTGVITLADATTAMQFEEGMTLNACTGSDGSGVRAAAGYVIAVDYAAGTVTVSATAGGAAGDPSSWSTDYLVVAGDAAVSMNGLASWIPTTAPAVATDNFFGVNRGKNPVRLAGFRHNGTAVGMEEAFIDGLSKAGAVGCLPEYAFLGYTSFGGLLKSLHAKVEYIDIETDVGVSFSGVRIHGPKGDVKIVPDNNCPGQLCYCLDLSTWKLVSLGDVPSFLDEDDMMIRAVSNQDAYEVRIGYYGNLGCELPLRNCVIQLPA